MGQVFSTDCAVKWDLCFANSGAPGISGEWKCVLWSFSSGWRAGAELVERPVPHLPACDTNRRLLSSRTTSANMQQWRQQNRPVEISSLPHTQAHEEKSRGSHDTGGDCKCVSQKPLCDILTKSLLCLQVPDAEVKRTQADAASPTLKRIPSLLVIKCKRSFHQIITNCFIEQVLSWRLPPGVTDKHGGPNSFSHTRTNGWSQENRPTSATVTPSVISDGKTEAQRSKAPWTTPERPRAQELGACHSSEPSAQTRSSSHLLKHRHIFSLWPS